MSRREKLLKRFLAEPRDFSWRELEALLVGFGYELRSGGRTGGSRVRFVHSENGPISLHKPHRGSLKQYQLEQIRALLEEEGLL